MSSRENNSEEKNSRFLEEEAENQLSDEYKDLEEKPAEKDAAEDFDYVIPDTTYKQRHKKHRRKHKKSSSQEKAPVDDAMDGYVFATPRSKRHRHRHHRHKKKMALWKKILLIVLCVILGLAIILTSTFFILREIGRRGLHNYEDIDISIPIKDENGNDAADVIDKGRTIKYGGKTYRLNEDMIAITFIGFKESDPGENENYMSDTVNIIAIDDKTGKTTILGVSRDTMLDVNVYSKDGDFIDTEKLQLAYAYSYFGGDVTGGDNVNTTLTRMLFGLPINNYFAIDLNALADLNDAIGGVTLTSKMDFESSELSRPIYKGEQVTLYGKDVEKYVQSREHDKVDANNERMDRQQQYIKAFLQAVFPAVKKDLSVVTELYGVVKENADTTIDLPKVTYLASSVVSKMRSANEIEYLRLNGKMKMGENAEMYLDDKDVLETMLKVFYKPVE